MSEPLTIDDMKHIASEKGGWCLSEEYINQLTKLTWKCAKGHIWETIPKHVRKGSWCPVCSRESENRKRRTILTIEDMRRLAEKRNGSCLSENYLDAKNKLLWKCQVGHIWEAQPNQIRKGTWCPLCSSKSENRKRQTNITIVDMRQLAEERGGSCLSDTYIHSKTKLLWKCSDGHIWESTPSNIKNGRWCPTCAQKNNGRYQRYDMARLHSIAESKGGKCLVEEYTHSEVKIPWECKEGHVFETPPIQVLRGSWCPYCSGRYNYSIEKMHQIAEKRGGKCLSNSYKNVFTKLKWQCANGHEFEAIPKHINNGHWCPNCTIYLNEQRCRYILETLFDAKFMKDQCVLNGFELDGYNKDLKLAFEYHGKQHYEHIDYFYSRGDLSLEDRKERDRLKENLCKELGIELLIIPYTVNPEEHVSFIAKELTEKEFKFKIDPSTISFDNYTFTNQHLQEIQDIAESRGGKCLSNVYINVDSKLDFICANGHSFSNTPYHIKKGQWCRKCSYAKMSKLFRLDESEIQRIAKEKGWTCLSTEYKNARE